MRGQTEEELCTIHQPHICPAHFYRTKPPWPHSSCYWPKYFKLKLVTAIAQAYLFFIDASDTYSCIYKAPVSPALNESSVVQHIKYNSVIKLHNGIIFNYLIGTAMHMFPVRY